jgi:hypothetical protein
LAAARRFLRDLFTQLRVTLGTVYEPYLTLTAHLDIFQNRLMEGFTFAESAFMSMAALSWMNVALGDPLYRPYAVWRRISLEKTQPNPWERYREIVQAFGGNILAAHPKLSKAARESGNSLFLEALAGRGRIVITAADSAAQQYETVFPDFFISAFGEEQADLDRNGKISIWEAFQSASARVKKWFEDQGRLATERPLLDDNGDGIGGEAEDSSAGAPKAADGSLARATYLQREVPAAVPADAPEVVEARRSVESRVEKLLSINGSRTVDSFHRELGKIMWEYCGMARSAEGLRTALEIIPRLRDEFWHDVRIPGTGAELNQSLEHAGRVADFLELAELMCLDALHREESCGGHFRVEHQTADGEALRRDDQFAYVAAWEFAGEGKAPILNKEPLVFENVALSQRSYK